MPELQGTNSSDLLTGTNQGDVIHGNPEHFAARIFELKPHPGSVQSAMWIREHLAPITHRSPARLQDRYSIRCAPQVDRISRHPAIREPEFPPDRACDKASTVDWKYPAGNALLPMQRRHKNEWNLHYLLYYYQYYIRRAHHFR